MWLNFIKFHPNSCSLSFRIIPLKRARLRQNVNVNVEPKALQALVDSLAEQVSLDEYNAYFKVLP